MGLERLRTLPEVTKLVAELGLDSSLFYSQLQIPYSQSSLGQPHGVDRCGFCKKPSKTSSRTEQYFFKKRVNL